MHFKTQTHSHTFYLLGPKFQLHIYFESDPGQRTRTNQDKDLGFILDSSVSGPCVQAVKKAHSMLCVVRAKSRQKLKFFVIKLKYFFQDVSCYTRIV